jgi:hypothetical protein
VFGGVSSGTPVRGVTRAEERASNVDTQSLQ